MTRRLHVPRSIEKDMCSQYQEKKASRTSSRPPESLHDLPLLPFTVRVKDEADGPLTASLADPGPAARNARGGGTTAADAGAGIRARARHVLGADVFTRRPRM